MQTLAVLALVIGLILLIRSLGSPVRRLPGWKKSARRNPEEDVGFFLKQSEIQKKAALNRQPSFLVASSPDINL